MYLLDHMLHLHMCLRLHVQSTAFHNATYVARREELLTGSRFLCWNGARLVL